MAPPSLLAEVGGRSETTAGAPPSTGVSIPAPTASAGELITVDLLSRTAAQITPGFVPGVESRKPTTESSTINIGTGIPMEVRIQLPVKP